MTYKTAEHDDEKEVYIVWATAQQGDGKVMKLGEYEDVTDIEINTSIIGPDVLITIERTVV